MRLLLFLLLCFAVPSAFAQGWGLVEGRTTEAPQGIALPGVTVVVDGTGFGTASDDAGYYALRLPSGRYALRFSAVGYSPRVDSVTVRRGQTSRLDAALRATTVDLDEVMVEAQQGSQEAGVYTLDPEAIQDMPAPLRDVLRGLKVIPGVAANNELSNQFSVRGGGFNENLLFLNGFEVYLPFRPRQGEQEGLSLFNPDLAEGVTFYTGGFPARYGGKLSSALDVRYRRPHDEPVRGSASASLLDVTAHAGGGAAGGRLGWLFGLRKAQARHFFATQELKGEYRPDYTDLQGFLTYQLAPGHTVEALGVWADHTFNLDPNSRKTFFGTISQDSRLAPSNLKSLWTRYDPDNAERDGYTTAFGGLRLANRLSARLRMEHDVALFDTDEVEQYDLSGTAVLFQVDPGSENPQGGEGLFPTGSSRQEDAADNRVAVRTATAQGRWLFTTRRHAAEAGWMARTLRFEDRLNEKSVVVGRATDGTIVRLVADSLRDAATLSARQAGFYLQNTFDALANQPDRLTVTGGFRLDYFSFNGEWTASPRLSARYRHSARTTFTAAWGLYHQAPTYRELRGRPEPGETLLGALNPDLRAQRSSQFVAGVEYFFPQRRLYLRGEGYYKHLTHVISYDIENVRVRYAGENDARARSFGFDLQLRGEFVPGLESWANYSFLHSRETFLPAFEDDFRQGTVPRPTDQRHTVSLFVQDYIPTDPTWKLHLRTLFGSGLPYTPPVPGERVGSLVSQVPGDRFSARYPPYFRFDVGLTKEIVLLNNGFSGPVALALTGELLNVFDMTNTVTYTWIPDASGIWNRIPTRLTPRTINVRLRVVF